MCGALGLLIYALCSPMSSRAEEILMSSPAYFGARAGDLVVIIMDPMNA